MPDISMCDSKTCPLKAKCYRNPASGTKPSEHRQAWFMGLEKEGQDCDYYWPKGSGSIAPHDKYLSPAPPSKN